MRTEYFWDGEKIQKRTIYTSLYDAVEAGDIEAVREFIAQGADVTEANNFAVKWAARYGYGEIVRLLQQHGAELDQTADLPTENLHDVKISYRKFKTSLW